MHCSKITYAYISSELNCYTGLGGRLYMSISTVVGIVWYDTFMHTDRLYSVHCHSRHLNPHWVSLARVDPVHTRHLRRRAVSVASCPSERRKNWRRKKRRWWRRAVRRTTAAWLSSCTTNCRSRVSRGASPTQSWWCGNDVRLSWKRNYSRYAAMTADLIPASDKFISTYH